MDSCTIQHLKFNIQNNFSFAAAAQIIVRNRIYMTNRMAAIQFKTQNAKFKIISFTPVAKKTRSLI